MTIAFWRLRYSGPSIGVDREAYADGTRSVRFRLGWFAIRISWGRS